MILLKQSTAVDVLIGPFVDDTDGNTVEDGLTISQADVRLSKNGANMAQKNDSDACAHDELGYYACPLDATDTNTLGVLKIMVHESGALPVFADCMVVTANVWDTLCGSDMLQADLTQIGGVAQSATDLKDFADTGYDPSAHKVQGVVLTDTCTTNTDLVSAASIADAVWDEASAGHTDAGKAGQQLWTDIDAILTDTNELQTDDIPGTLSTIDGKIDTVDGNVDSVLTDTGTTIPGTITSLQSDVTDILADTNELQSDDIPGTLSTIEGKIDTADTVVDAIKAKTDSLTFTVAGVCDANITYVNEVEVGGAGVEGNPWGPA